MNDSFDNSEAGNIWRNQTTEGITLSASEIRKRVEHLKSKSRRERLIRISAATAGLLTWIGMLLLGDNPFRVWFYVAGMVSYMVLLTQLPGMAASYLFSKRLVTLELTSRSKPCLDFYQKEMELRRASLRDSRTSMAIAGLVGLFLLLFGSRDLSRDPLIAICLGLSMMIAAILWYYRMKRDSPRIQREIEELESFRRNQT